MNLRTITFQFSLLKKLIVLFGVVVFLASCGDSVTPSTPTSPTVNTCPTSGSGQLNVSISAPSSVSANVLIKGATSQSLSASDTLTLAAGKYHIKVKRTLSESHPLVQDAYGALQPLQEVCVKANETTNVNVSYVLQPGSGHLWSSGRGGIVGLSRAQLAAPSSADASIKLSYPFKTFMGLSFDDMGRS